MTNNTPASERAQTAIRQLTNSATNLNKASDEMREIFSTLDDVLTKLNLGIPGWVRITGDDSPNGDFWSRDIGYAKCGETWGIALREIRGNYEAPEELEIGHEKVWLFNDAPRWMRIEAVGKIPELLEHLTKQADQTTQRIKNKTAEAKELTAAIRAAADESKLNDLLK